MVPSPLSYRERLAWPRRSSRHRLQPRAQRPWKLSGFSDVQAAKELRDNRRKRVGRVPVEVVTRSVVAPCRPRVRVASSVLDVAQRLLLQQPLAPPSKLLQVGAQCQVAASSLRRSNRQSETRFWATAKWSAA